MSAHTPGPWKLRKGFDEDTKEVFRPNPKLKKPFYPTELAVVRGDDREGLANARLIAAAPDLLAAVEAFILYDSDGVIEGDHIALMLLYAEAIRLAKSAHAKATGSQ